MTIVAKLLEPVKGAFRLRANADEINQSLHLRYLVNQIVAVARLGLNAIKDKDTLAVLAVHTASVWVFNTAQFTLVFMPILRAGGKAAGRPSQRHVPKRKDFGFESVAHRLHLVMV